MQSARALRDHQEQLALDSIHREIREKLPESLRAHSRIVGKWVWIEVPFGVTTKRKTAKQLKKLGFHFSKRRSAWQHPCGVESKRSRKDPRGTYHCQPLDRSAKLKTLVNFDEIKTEKVGDTYTPF